MKPGDLVSIRKSHPAVKHWRRNYRNYGAPFIGQWAEEGASLLVLEQPSSVRTQVFGPGGQLASFDNDLLKPASKYWQVIADIRAKDS